MRGKLQIMHVTKAIVLGVQTQIVPTEAFTKEKNGHV